MTDDSVALRELLEKNADADLLREMIAFAAERLMELEVQALRRDSVPFCWTSPTGHALLGACQLPCLLRPTRPDRCAGGASGGGSAVIASARNAARSPAVSLSTSQRLILATAAARADRAVLPMPDGLTVRGRARRLMLEGMIKRGLIAEQPARDSELAWAHSDDEFGLEITLKGRALVGSTDQEPSSRDDQPPEPATPAGRRERAEFGIGRPLQGKAGVPHQAGAAD